MQTRIDIKATPEEVYRKSLEDRLRPVREKTWAELTPEEKDLLQEALAFQGGHVRAPR